MGKRLQTKFLDVNLCIIKRSRRNKKKSERELPKLKRKTSTDLVDEPPQKKFKNEPLDKNLHHDNWYIERIDEFNNETVYTENLTQSMDIVLKIKNAYSDLLYTDELKNSFLNLIYKDFYFHILDEIGLEGLDGITLEAFWKRLYIALEGFPAINQPTKNFIWQKVITCSKHLKMFELPIARKELEIYNRFDYINADIGVVLELAYDIPDIYPPNPVVDPLLLGSCSTFDDRVDITDLVKNLSISKAEERYGLKLVLVANQNVRTNSLCGDIVDPLIEFLNTEYCILERVGRSRKLGELTQGRMSIGLAFNMDPRSVFHYKKQLSTYEVISKQSFVIKSPLLDQNKTGSLLHLRRFYTNIRTHQSLRADEIINLLKKQPHHRIESRKLRSMYSDNYPYILKLLKSNEFRKFVKLKVYPYKELYPNALPIEYTNKNNYEKTLTCYELINPYVNVLAYWRTDDHEDSDDEDEKEEELSGNLIYNKDTIRNVYYQIYLSGDEGLTAMDIKQKLGLDTNTVRVGLRKLDRKGVVKYSKTDFGKIRKHKYTAIFPKKPNEQFCHTLNTESEEPKVSSVKAKLLEKQRAAIAKIKEENSNKPKKPEETNLNNNFLKVEKPQISGCKYLIQSFKLNIEPKVVISYLKEDIHLLKKYAIDLTYIAFDKKHLININKILNEVNPILKNPLLKQNFENVYVKKYSNKNMQTTLLLIRAVLGEIIIDKNLFESDSKNESKFSIPDITKQTSPKQPQLKLDYMGSNPTVEYYEKESDLTVEIIASTTPSQFTFEKKYVTNDTTLTKRVIERIQIILDLVNEMKIIEEIIKLLRLIIEIEANNGYDKKLDRKPLFRFIKRLVEEGYIKVYKLVLYNNVINKTVLFICHPSVNYTHDVIKSGCQQLKWKFFTSVAKKSLKPQLPALQKTLQNNMGNSPFNQSDVLNSISEMKNLDKKIAKEINKKFNRKIGIVYGSKPKFTRMRIMHEFLFYLIYGFTGFTNPLLHEDVRQLFKSYRIELSDSDMKEMPNVHSNEISWKMFVPPLPEHTAWPKGWALVCDIILRLPISVLLKIHHCSFEDPELLEILNHPVKRFFLVKDLPERIRKTVLFKRKYLFSANDTIRNLVFCGLVQLGPQKYKEKDQLFVYLNQRTSLKDTSTSAPGYNEIETKEYPTLTFYFNTYLDLQHYWQSLNRISLNTKLNAREPGKVVTLTFANSKLRSVKSRTPNEAVLHDNGTLPGDGKGAAGLDSSMWVHLIRNWHWSSKGVISPHSLYKNETLEQIPSKTISFKDMRANTIPKFYLPSTTQKIKRNTQKKREKNKRLTHRQTKFTRVIKKRPGKNVKRQYNDEVDKKIIKKMGVSRSKWVQQEEEPLLLCKIGDIVMSGTKIYKKQIVPYTVVRDVLHIISPASKYKTSRAIQRFWIRSRRYTFPDLEAKVPNLFKLKPIGDTIALLIRKIGVPDEKTLKPFKLTDSQIASAYIMLMSYICRNKRRILDTLEGNLVNNDHLSEENLKFTEEAVAMEEDKKEKKFFDPRNEIDIKKDIVKSIIHSSLSSKGTSNFSNQLFKIYQNYSDNLIKESVKELRDSNTISYRSKKNKKAKVWDTPFSLSQFYIFFQYSTFSNVTAEEAYHAFVNIIKHGGKNIEGTVVAVENKRYGQLLGVNEMFSFYSHIRFMFYLPQSTIILNPDIDNHDELVNELAIRYQLTLKLLQEGNETEMDFETENENYRSKTPDELASIEEDKEICEITERAKPNPNDNQDTTLEFAADSGDSDTINRLKTWITDCMTAESERRSPSPEFMIHTESDKNSADFKNEETIDKIFEENEETHSSSKEITGGDKNLGHIPTLDEIKEGMLKSNINDEERTIPHITELSDLLTKNFTDLKMDTEKLLELKYHFVSENVTLDHLIIDEFNNLKDFDLVHYLDNSMKNKDIWSKIESDIIVKDFLKLPHYEELIKRSGGNDEDVSLAAEIIQFAANKEFLGATGKELKDVFLWREQNYTLTNIIKNLIEAGILLQLGIATLTFVHYKYQYAWLVDRECTEPVTPSTSTYIQGTTNFFRMKMMPWVRINGLIDRLVLKNWLANILSYTLDFPKVTFGKLCKKFCYIKPVDLYYIIQILEELGCVELIIYEDQEKDIFTEWTMPLERNATILDNQEDIMIQPQNVSMIRLGSFLCEAAP